jgi:EAL domain-containing protein (putative c-di-GMP-specific phosphodiesterase class I)
VGGLFLFDGGSYAVMMTRRRRPSIWTLGDQPLTLDTVTSVRTLAVDDLPTVFQPIVDLHDGSAFAYEALARCTKPPFTSPIALFEHAIEEGMCGRVGRLIREATFARCPDRPLFINIHPSELAERWLVRPDDPICYHSHGLFLEVTEAAAFEYFDVCMSVLKEICARTGGHLVLDDFGAGYSNLNRVAELKPEYVKLDRSLVANIDVDKRKRTLVFYVAGMLSELGATVIAEGIETEDELGAVRDLGIRYGQGYLLARPGYPLPEVSFPFARRPRVVLGG